MQHRAAPKRKKEINVKNIRSHPNSHKKNLRLNHQQQWPWPAHLHPWHLKNYHIFRAWYSFPNQATCKSLIIVCKDYPSYFSMKQLYRLDIFQEMVKIKLFRRYVYNLEIKIGMMQNSWQSLNMEKTILMILWAHPPKKKY